MKTAFLYQKPQSQKTKQSLHNDHLPGPGAQHPCTLKKKKKRTPAAKSDTTLKLMHHASLEKK
jgi:hypothetical protein